MARSAYIVLIWIVLQETKSQVDESIELSGPRPFNTKQHANEKIHPPESGQGQNQKAGNASAVFSPTQRSSTKSKDSLILPSSENILFGLTNYSSEQNSQTSPPQISLIGITQDASHVPKNNLNISKKSQDTLIGEVTSNQTLDHLLSTKSTSIHLPDEILKIKAANGTLERQKQNLAVNIPLESSTTKPDSSSKQSFGTLYVGSVHKSVYPSRSLKVGSVMPCTAEDFEDKDLHQLSNSQFGYPKSIVNTAVGGSDVEKMLNMMANHLQVLSTRYGNDLPPADMVKAFLKPAYNTQVGDGYSHHHERSPKLFSKLFENSLTNNKVALRNEGERMLGKLGSTIPKDHSFDPRLSGSLKSAPNSEFPKDVQKGATIKSAFLLDDSVFGLQQQEFPLRSEKPGIGGSVFKNIFPEAQADGVNSQDSQIDETPLSVQNSKHPKDHQGGLGESLQDITGNGASWLPSSFYPGTFSSSFKKLKPKAYNSDIHSLFPPKPKNHFMDVASSNDFDTAKEIDFIKYSPDRSSNVASPFQLDTKSLLNTISSGRFGEGVSSQPINFGAASGLGSESSLLSSLTSQPSKNDNQATMARLFKGEHFQIPSHIRTKRQAREEDNSKKNDPSNEAVCPTVHNILRQYKNHGGTCFVVEPEIQGIHFTSCSNERCQGCHVDGGDSRCQAVRVPTWVWSYCEEGPNAGKVIPDRIQVSVACTCQIFRCQSEENNN